jgi:hypothetical protein
MGGGVNGKDTTFYREMISPTLAFSPALAAAVARRFKPRLKFSSPGKANKASRSSADIVPSQTSVHSVGAGKSTTFFNPAGRESRGIGRETGS